MSALAQQPDLQNPRFHFGRLGEFEATSAVSRVAARATLLDEGLHAVSAVVLQLNGVCEMNLEDAAAIEALVAGPLAWRGDAGAGPQGSAIADIAAAGRRWGTLRLQFNLKKLKIQDPLAFARFVGQQAGILLNRFSVQRERDLLLARIRRFEERLATRKAFERAKGIIARQRGITDEQAGRLLMKHSRGLGRPLRVIAEAIVFDHEHTIRFGSHAGAPLTNWNKRKEYAGTTRTA